MNESFDDSMKDGDLELDSQINNDFHSSPSNDPLSTFPETIKSPDKVESSTSESEEQGNKDPFQYTANLLLDDEETMDDLLLELDSLIGLLRVKEEVRRLIQYVKVRKLRSEQGISESSMVLHSVFYGSPGTGKTTVARIYGRMLKSMGILSEGHLIETDRAGLVANYVGQTATKTDEKITAALGGILFIDEAYSLSQEDQSSADFGSEAIQILMKRMEDHRDDFVVIVAGYPQPMKSFLRSNEGFKSRFSTYLYFSDFTPEEMVEIFKYFCKQENYDIDNEALKSVRTAIEFKHTLRDKTFGNARFVRNFFEAVIRNHASRVGTSIEEPTVTDLRLLKFEDIPLTIADGG
jgi:SpoVK/Ycf46/Vps4 family AAA+-type ATPase